MSEVKLQKHNMLQSLYSLISKSTVFKNQEKITVFLFDLTQQAYLNTPIEYIFNQFEETNARAYLSKSKKRPSIWYETYASANKEFVIKRLVEGIELKSTHMQQVNLFNQILTFYSTCGTAILTQRDYNGLYSLGELIYDCVVFSLDYDDTSELTDETPIYNSLDENKELNRYNCYIGVYALNNKDRFNALKYLADNESNPYACCELGDLYYYGATLHYDNSNKMIIDSNKSKAACYYGRGSKKGHAPCCWALGDMILKGYIPGTAFEKAEGYFRIGEKEKYPPSLNSLGVIFLDRGRKSFNSGDMAQAAKFFSESVRFFDAAAEKGLVYGDNRLWAFFSGDEYQCVKDSIDLTDVKGPHGARERLERSALRGNAWAMNRFALVYLLPEGRIKEAFEYFRKAAEYGDAWACYNLATKFSEYECCFQLQEEEYKDHLGFASSAGISDATLQLIKYYVRKSIEDRAQAPVYKVYAQYMFERLKSQHPGNLVLSKAEKDLAILDDLVNGKVG